MLTTAVKRSSTIRALYRPAHPITTTGFWLRLRSAVLLVAGDKSGQWKRWYRETIPEAEQLYATYLKEREKEIGDGRG